MVVPLFPLMKLKLLKKETEFCYGIDSSTPDLDPALLLWLFAFLPESNVIIHYLSKALKGSVTSKALNSLLALFHSHVDFIA